MSTNIVSLREKPDQLHLNLHESISVSRVSDGANLRFRALPAWSWTVVVLIIAAMSGCRGTDLIGSVSAAPMRLASPKSFIAGLGEDVVNDAIVRLIVDFAHTLGLKVTAEGVENERQVASLTAMSCDLAQGFYFSKPLPSEPAGTLVASDPLWRMS